MNDLLESHIAYFAVLQNITAMEEQHICRLDIEIGRECDADSVCSHPTSAEDEFFCQTYGHLVNITWEMYQLINTDILVVSSF